MAKRIRDLRRIPKADKPRRRNANQKKEGGMFRWLEYHESGTPKKLISFDLPMALLVLAAVAGSIYALHQCGVTMADVGAVIKFVYELRRGRG